MATTPRPNPHASLARAAKVQALTSVVDGLLSAVPLAGSDAAVRWLDGLSSTEWARLALCAAVRPPSAETRRLVREHYQRRCEAAQRVLEAV